MRLLEVRDGFIKFEADENIHLASFVKVLSAEKTYVAQVIQLKKSESAAFGKILFLYNGKFIDYDGTIPERDSIVEDFTQEFLDNSVKVKTPVVAGKTVCGKNIKLDISCFNKKTIISVDDTDANNLIVKNLSKQFNGLTGRIVIIDSLGIINTNKYTAGKDFKLPLDTASLMFMYEECLNDATGDSKSMIVDIFKDLSEYSKTVSFVPFATLKSIVDEMVDKSHIFKLLVLKNKLAKFSQFGYFANDIKEVKKIEKVFASKVCVVDLSKLDSAFKNRYLSYIYSKLNENDNVIFELSNSVTKKSLKQIFDSKVRTTFITHSKFKYLNEIKNLFDNYFIVPSEENNRIFSIFSTFLRAMSPNTYLIAGEGTGYVPLISSLTEINDIEAPSAQDDDVILEELANEQEEENEPEIDEEEDEVLAEITEKSKTAISNIQETLEKPEDMTMFDEEDEETLEDEPAQETENIELSETVEEPATEVQEYASEAELLQEEQLLEASQENSQEENIIEPQVIDIEAEEITPLEEDNIKENIENDLLNEEQEIIDEENAEPLDLSSEEYTEADETTDIVLDEDINLDLEQASESIEENEPELVEKEPSEEAVEKEEEVQVISLEEDDFGASDVSEIDLAEADENDIVIDLTDDVPDESVEEQIKQDVDKVYTTIKEEEDFSESDLDFIDELNNEESGETIIVNEDSSDDTILEEITEQQDGEIEDYVPPLEETDSLEENSIPEILEKKDSTTPIVPVYDAEIPQEDIVMSDPIEQGDTVTHVKYGTGVVEKLVKYGQKTLYMINFDMTGRKLLDPLLTEIKKV